MILEAQDIRSEEPPSFINRTPEIPPPASPTRSAPGDRTDRVDHVKRADRKTDSGISFGADGQEDSRRPGQPRQQQERQQRRRRWQQQVDQQPLPPRRPSTFRPGQHSRAARARAQAHAPAQDGRRGDRRAPGGLENSRRRADQGVGVAGGPGSRSRSRRPSHALRRCAR